jgi:hypothetical protein
MAKLNQILLGLALLLCAAPLAAQSCYVQLDDATGVPLPPSQLAELEVAACELRAAFPVEFQNDFAIYDFGFYLHQEGFADGVPGVFQAKVAEVEQESAYFLLFGRQLSRGGVTSEVWVEVRLPEGSQYPCLDERAWMIQQLAKAAADEVYANQGRSILAYAAAADSSMSFLQSQIDFAVNCCPLTGGRTVANPNCPASYLDNVGIPEVLGIAGFVALENVQNVRVDSISTPYDGGNGGSSIPLEIVVDVARPNGQVQANINITQELLEAKGLLQGGMFVSIQEFDIQNDKAALAELYGNEVDLNSIGNGFTYWEELLAVKDGDTYTLYTRTGGHGGAQFRGGSLEVRSQAVILPAIVVRIVLRRAVMAASNVAINLFIEFVMERTFGDHGPDCTWLETASYMDIHPWRIGLWALEGAVGGHSIALAAVFGGADAAITYLLTTGSGQFSLDAFFLKVTEGALIGAGASHLSTVILNSKTAKKFFARVEAQTGSTIAQLENELFPLWKHFLKDFRRVGAWEALIEFPQYRARPDILEHYPNVKRIGSYGPDVQPFEISNLVRTHPVPRPGNENLIPELASIFSTTGYNLNPDDAIHAVRLPNGSNLIINGNHRLQAMLNLNQKITPVNLFTFEEGNGAFGATNVAMFAEVSRLTGFYNGPPVPASDPSYITALAKNWLDDNFPGWQ